MSDVPRSGRTGPGAMGGSDADQPTEEELRAALGQLRGAPVDQIVAEVASALLNAAQVKLGRKDGRLLIDVLGVMTDRLRGGVPEELTRQLDEVLTQLRLAQVEAEREVAAAASQGHEEPNDLAADHAPADTAGDASPSTGGAGSPPPTQPPATSRLWIPGR